VLVPFAGARRGPWACMGGGRVSRRSVVCTRDRVAGAGYACSARPDLHTVCRSFHKISSALSAKVRGGSRSAREIESQACCEVRRVRSLIPWRRAADAMVEAELRHRVALAEEQLADLKTALDDMRAQRDAWQAMAQARIRPAPSGQSRWPWLRSTG
jgi:hypothetical protein